MDQNQQNQQTKQQPQSAEQNPKPSNLDPVQNNSSSEIPTSTSTPTPAPTTEQNQQTDTKIVGGKEFLQTQALKPLEKKDNVDSKLQEIVKESEAEKSKKKTLIDFITSLVKKTPSEGPAKITSTPNLLFEAPVNPVVEKHHLTVSTVAKVLVIAIQATFILLLGFNTKTVSDITKIENEVRALETQLTNKQNAITTIEETIEKTDRLRELQRTDVNLGQKLQTAIDNTPQRVLITETDITPTTFEMVIETSSPLDASFLMSSYINNNVAQQIVLKAASLSRATGKFLTTLEVTFK